MSDWNCTSPVAWARLSGMVHVPLFGRSRRAEIPGDHALLLDGPNASVALSIGDSHSLIEDNNSISWVWSSNLTYSVILDVARNKRFVRSWDRPGDIEEGPLPDAPEAADLIEFLARRQRPTEGTVIEKMLGVFRRVRNNIDERGGTNKDTIRSFNTLLMWTHAIQRGVIDPLREGRPSAIRDILPILARHGLIRIRAESLSPSVQSFPIGDLLDAIIDRDPDTNLVLDPDLFIRHAAGVLYQEAHRDLDRRVVRRPRQMTLFEDFTMSAAPARGVQQRDAHFTPSSLARTLVQEAIREIASIRNLPNTLRILDPACGSGVFLVEARREIAAEDLGTKVLLSGFDKSAVARIMTKFCVSHAADDEQGANRPPKIFPTDSLQQDAHWGRPDIILMNPPFIPWKRMNDADKQNVRRILEKTPGRLPDTSFAFIAKAIQSLKAGAALATVIPASFLNGDAAANLRRAIVADPSLSIRLIGRFRSLDFFPGATVEPAILVIVRLIRPRKRRAHTIRCLFAEAGHEDEALRGFRRGDCREAPGSFGWEIYDKPEELIARSNWLPVSQRSTKLFESMKTARIPSISDLFDVRLNVQTGGKKVFIVSGSEVSHFSADPGFGTLFQPVVDEIRHGGILSRSFVFYPYDNTGNELVSSDEELERSLPLFYREKLLPNKMRLSERPGIQGRPWWSLNRPRASWAIRVPKLVTPQFGMRGTFAYDETGRHVVLQGNAWFWRRGDFDASRLPWAYLAILNSPIFEAILAELCPRVLGGQFNLNTKYIGIIPLPDLSDKLRGTAILVDDLATLGRRIAAGDTPDAEILDEKTAKAYGIPLSRMRTALDPAAVKQAESRFRQLAAEWNKATAHLCNLRKIIGHPTYREIVSMGESVVPFLLAGLKREPDWAPALAEITGENPVPSKMDGDIREIARDWTTWGRQRGYEV